MSSFKPLQPDIIPLMAIKTEPTERTFRLPGRSANYVETRLSSASPHRVAAIKIPTLLGPT